MQPHELYREIWNDAGYTTGRMDLQYKLIKRDMATGKLFLLFQPTHSALDWCLNILSCIPFFGYALGWRIVWLANRKSLIGQIAEAGNKSIVVAGHSYGGAVAVNAGIAIHKALGVKPELVTFGCPKCLFLHPFARRHFSKVEQWAERNDLVAHLPLGFHNVKVRLVGTKGKLCDLLHVQAWHYFSYFNKDEYI